MNIEIFEKAKDLLDDIYLSHTLHEGLHLNRDLSKIKMKIVFQTIGEGNESFLVPPSIAAEICIKLREFLRAYEEKVTEKFENL